jgi:molybdenum cofactor synthesis domain-containing protein
VISLDDARQHVVAACSPLPVEAVALADALGCVTAAAIVASEPVPPFANTAMDGYAVRAADTQDVPATLTVTGTLAAGDDPTGHKVGAGEAVRIMTGAPIPPGADAIVMVERTHTADAGAAVVVEVCAALGDHIRPAGEDLASGQEVFAAGTLLGAGHLGVLASLGVEAVEARRAPRVGVLSTGDELLEGGGPLRLGQIRDSNRPTLLALVAASGFEAVDLGLIRDDEVVIDRALHDGLARCDAVVTSGGVSMGEFDYVRAVLDRLAAGEVTWMQVAIRPAKPLSFAVVDGKPVFGLPGNPVSSMVSFELFARPALRKMMGFPPDALDRPRVTAVADDGLARHPDGKLHLARVVCEFGADGRYHVRSSGGQASNLLRAMALANALALVPDGDGIAPGGDVDVLLLS